MIQSFEWRGPLFVLIDLTINHETKTMVLTAHTESLIKKLRQNLNQMNEGKNWPYKSTIDWEHTEAKFEFLPYEGKWEERWQDLVAIITNWIGATPTKS